MKRSIWKRILVLILALSMIMPTIGSILPEVDAYPNGINGSTATGPTSNAAGWLPDGVYAIKAKITSSDSALYWTLDTSSKVNGQKTHFKLQSNSGTPTEDQLFVIQRVFDEDVAGDGSGSYYRIRPVSKQYYVNRQGAGDTTGYLQTWYSEAMMKTNVVGDHLSRIKISVDTENEHYKFQICTVYNSETGAETWKWIGKFNSSASGTTWSEGDFVGYTNGHDDSCRFYLEPVQVLSDGTYTMQSLANTSAAMKTQGVGRQAVTYTNYGVKSQQFKITTSGGYCYIQDSDENYLSAAELHGNDDASKAEAEKEAHTRVRFQRDGSTDAAKWLAIPILNDKGEMQYSFVSYATGGYLYSCGNLTNIENHNGVCTQISDLSERIDWKLNLVESKTIGDMVNEDTGVFRDSFRENRENGETVKLPIKIYDYVNDGLLFEYANAGSGYVNDFYGYQGGAGVPMFTYGANFTLGRAYFDLGSQGDTGAPGNYLSTSSGITTNYINYKDGTYTDTVTPKDLGQGPSVLSYEGYTTTTREFLTIADFSYMTSSSQPAPDDVRYFTMVYRVHNTTTGLYDKAQFQLVDNNGNTWETSELTGYETQNTFGKYTDYVFDLSSAVDQVTGSRIKYIRMKLPIPVSGDTTTGKLCVSYFAFFKDEVVAEEFGEAALEFMANPGKFVKWRPGNNNAFGLLRASQGGAWEKTSVTDEKNTYTTGQLGSDHFDTTAARKVAQSYLANGTMSYDYNHQDTGLGIYFIDKANDLSELPSVGKTPANDQSFTLYTDLTKGLCTVGLVRSKLNITTDAYGNVIRRPEYSDATVAYIANQLQGALGIQETDCCNTNIYHYNYVKGEVDADRYGEGKDLAQALRECLASNPNAKNVTCTNNHVSRVDYVLGNWADTSSHTAGLIGTWAQCKGNIKTCYDAAYYLLNNLFNPVTYEVEGADNTTTRVTEGSYSTIQNEYDYLVLTKAKLSDGSGKEAYVFDAGFTSSLNVNYAELASTVQYGKRMIYNLSANSKTQFLFDNWGNSTTYFPFLPVQKNNVQIGETKSPYFLDDATVNMNVAHGTYEDRNYNYVLQSNGNFVYHADEDLFFEFEGDDDVYLFINGELVLDIGAAHSITGVRFNVNDYVTAAWEKVNNQTATERDKALALEEGKSYSFDFYYMERHGYGANMRIVTNIRVTDSSMVTEKTAYQGEAQISNDGIIDGASPVEYGFALTNTGNARMYNLTFADENIGINIDYTNGLTFDAADNQVRLFDANGGSLEVTDLYANVISYNADGSLYSTTRVVFDSNDELKQFLTNCTAPAYNQTGTILTDTEGHDGFWQGTRVEIRGFAYKLTDAQKTSGVFTNTVKSSATFGDMVAYGEADMRVFIINATQYYQWRAHELTVSFDKLLTDIKDKVASDNPLKNATIINEAVVSTAAGVANPANTNIKINGTNVIINYDTVGAQLFYLSIKTDKNTTKSEVVPVQVNVTDVVDSVFVLDYGLRLNMAQDHALVKGDSITIPGKTLNHVMEGICGEDATVGYGDNKITFTKDDNNIIDGDNGKFWLYFDSEGTTYFLYRPTDFMDGLDSIYIAYRVYEGDSPSTGIGTVNINKEVEMYKKVTVLPANVVYYEDDFEAIKYVGPDSDDTTADNVIQVILGQNADGTDKVGTSSTTNKDRPFQSADQDMAYGYDPTYEDLNNDNMSNGHISMSGKTVKKITINKKGDIASFEFTGTGFEIVSRTTANSSGTIAVSVKDSTGKEIRYIPVITEFDHNADGTNDTNDEAIYQVPVIRVEGLTHGEYTVTIVGYPAYNWSQGADGKWTSTPIDSYLYIDGIRIYNPLGSSEDTNYYLDTEKDAIFENVRDLIAGGKLAQVELIYTTSSTTESGDTTDESTTNTTPLLSLGTGTYTFVENRNQNDTIITQNAANSINEYLLAGPNTEVYLDGISKETALVLYVKPEEDSLISSLQIGIRALDHCKFYAGVQTVTSCTCCENMKVYLGIGSNVGTLSWEQIGDQAIISGTEQYYNINFAKCPMTDDGWYQVLIKVDGGMASVTNIKSKGLEKNSLTFHNDVATIKYDDGQLVYLNDGGNAVSVSEEETDYGTFSLIRRAMTTPMSNVTVKPLPDDEIVDPDDTQNPDDEVDPDDTENPDDVVDPDDTENPDDEVDPDDTEDTDDAVDPDDTEDPDNTTNPDDTEKPENETKPDDTTDPDDEVSAKTGDISIIHWMTLAAISMVAVLVLTVHERKRETM